MNNYVPTAWVNDSIPALDAENLNHIEAGVRAVTDAVLALHAAGISPDAIAATILSAAKLPAGADNRLLVSAANNIRRSDYSVTNSDGDINGGATNKVPTASLMYRILTARLAAKADAAATLEGYGIADAYTKAQIDEMRNAALFGVRDLDLYDTYTENADDNVILFLFGYDNNNSPTCGLDRLTAEDYGKVWHIVLTFTKANLAGRNSVTVQEHRRGQPMPDTLQHYDNVAQGDVIRFDYTMSDSTASILRLRLNARAGEQKVHVTISEVRQLNDVLDTLDTKANAADMNTALAAKADAADLPDFNEMEYASHKVDRISNVNNAQPADSVNYPSVNAVKALLGDGYFTRTESNPTVTAGFAGSGVPIFVSGNTMFSAGACTGNIVTLFVPRTVTKIDGGAFSNCASLTDVYIDNEAKSDDNPNGIEITSGAFGNSVTVHYNAKFNAVTQLIMAIHAGVS